MGHTQGDKPMEPVKLNTSRKIKNDMGKCIMFFFFLVKEGRGIILTNAKDFSFKKCYIYRNTNLSKQNLRKSSFF